MYKPEFVMENQTHKIHWDFEIQTYHLILARIPDLAIIKRTIVIQEKENLPNSEFFRLAKQQSENQRKGKVRQVLGPYQRTRKNNETWNWRWY